MERASMFQALKPVCIELSKSALSFPADRASAADVVKAQLELQRVLTSVADARPQDLDRKLADYVFFPLSHVLRQHQKLPNRALESCLESVLVLLRTAWRTHIEPKLGIQLLILLTILADPDGPNEEGSKKPEDLQEIIYCCFTEVLKSLCRTRDGRQQLLANTNIPYLGKAVYEILDGATAGPSQNVQLSALMALSSFIHAVDDNETLSLNFLPGIVSASQKILSPSTNFPRAYKVLVECLGILSALLCRVVSDAVAKDIVAATDSRGPDGKSKSRINKSWLDATTGQIRAVLATVMKLRSHGRAEVRTALFKFCLSLLQDCRMALSQSAPFLIDTALVIMANEGSERSKNLLIDLFRVDETLVCLLEDSLYNWIVSLPRVMQSQDETKKERLIAQVSSSYQILSEMDTDLSRVDGILASNLRDCVAVTFTDLEARAVQESAVGPLVDVELSLVASGGENAEWTPIIGDRGIRRAAVRDLANLTTQLAKYRSSHHLIEELVGNTLESDGLLQVSNFWTSVQVLRSALESDAIMDNFIDVQATSQDIVEEALEDLYNFSLDVVSAGFARDYDWKTQALALEVVALEAKHLGTDFRHELVEALFPIVQLIGSPNTHLRRHAMTCLNIIASECDYRDARELIIENVDYLVNAISLQMNSFEISPQAPHVLLMMVKLAGPRLLPYLDDTVESMFSALELYHGHTKLAEALFTTLMAIAEEGSKSEQLAITEKGEASQQLEVKEPMQVSSLAETLKSLKRKRENEGERLEDIAPGSFPQRPWKELSSQPADDDFDDNPSQEATDQDPTDSPAKTSQLDADTNPPAPKTYSILLKISDLTQHYLASPSPTFRAALLSLLHTTFPALAKHENSFLPLINTLWPVVVSRLDDPEAFVTANALETITCMCQYAGSFMRSRIVQLWGHLKVLARQKASLGPKKPQASRTTRSDLYQSAARNMVTKKPQYQMDDRSKPSTAYVDMPTRTIRDSLIKLLVAIVDYVEMDEDMFDDALQLLTPYIGQASVRPALERRNSDAVWLKERRLQSRQLRAIEGGKQEKRATTNARWQFPTLS